jgi:hypothetical protein
MKSHDDDEKNTLKKKSEMSVLNIQTCPSIRYDFRFMTRKIVLKLGICLWSNSADPGSCVAARLQRLRVRIPPEYGRLSFVSGRVLCDEPIPRPKVSYECVCVCHSVWTNATLTLSTPPMIRYTGVRMRKKDETVAMKNLQIYCNP